MTATKGLERADGVVVALLTPYRADGTIADDVLRALVVSLLSQGVDGFYVSGSTGDGVALDEDDRVRCTRIVAETVAGEVPVLTHVGTNSTAQTLRLAARAVAAGADAVSAIHPAVPLTPRETFGFFRDVIRGASAPFIAYNFPGRTGVAMSRDLLSELAEEPNLYGVKNTSSDVFQMSGFTRLRDGTLRVWNGHDEILYAGLSAGACGAIGSTFNVCPRLYLDLLSRFRAGDHAGALALQRQVEDFVTVLLAHGVMPSLRALLAEQGLDMGPSRRPLLDLDAEERRRLVAEIDALDLPSHA